MAIYGKETLGTLAEQGITLEQAFQMGLVPIGCDQQYQQWLSRTYCKTLLRQTMIQAMVKNAS